MSRLTLLALAWFAGLSLAAWQPPLAPCLITSLAGLLVLSRLGQPLRLAPRLVLLVVGLGYARGWLAEWRPALEAWRPLFDQEVTVTGVVDEDPIPVKGLVTVRLVVESVALNDQPQPLTPLWPANDPRALLCSLPWLCAPGTARPTPDWLFAPRPAIQARINVDRLPYGEGERLLRYGHRLTLSGKLREAPEFDLFPYRRTLARDGVYARLLSPKSVADAGGEAGFPPRAWALALRRQLDGIIRELLPAKPLEAGLLAGILLGVQNRLTNEMIEDLRSTSLSHIVVVSGFNITILAIAIGLLLRRVALGLAWLAALPLKYGRFGTYRWLLAAQYLFLPVSISYVLFHIAVLGGYAVFVGLDPSPVRAVLMACGYVLAKHVGRPSTTLGILGATAWFITLVTPWALVDIGFQLSFAAVLALTLLQPVLNSFLRVGRFVPPFDSPRRHWPYLPRSLAELVSTTLAATLMTTPILSYYFNQVSVIGLLANVLALPVQALIMFTGLGAVGLAWLAPAVAGLRDGLLVTAHALGSLEWVFLRYTVAVILTLAQAPWAAYDWRASGNAVLFMYTLLAVGGLKLALALNLVNFRSLFLVPPPPTPLPAPAAPPVPRPLPPPLAAGEPVQRPLGSARPVVALAERPGPYRVRPRRPAAPNADAPRSPFRFGAPTEPVSHAPLAPVGDRPTRPTVPLTASPAIAPPSEATEGVHRPLTHPVARQAMSRCSPHPRRPFDQRSLPRWSPWLRFRYVALFLMLWPLVALSWPLAAGRPDGLLHLTVLTPGDTVVVRTPHGERMVVGGGSWASDTNAEADWGHWPWDRRLGVVAASRLDRPYLESLNEVLARHPTRAAIAPPAPRSAAGQAWAGLVRARGATALRVDERLPMSLTLDGVTLDVAAYDEVEKATLYAVRWGEVRFVLGGGLRGPVELTPAPASVVLVSRAARPDLMTALARAYRPALWVVQVDRDADRDEPDWIDRLPSVLADRPTTLTSDGERLWIASEP